MTADEPNNPTYIGRDPQCGHIQFATVDVPERRKQVARDVAQAVRDGLTIERVTSSVVRAEGLCRCIEERRAKGTTAQQTLALPVSK